MKQVFVVLICLSIVCFVVSGAPTPLRRNCCKKYSKRVPDFKKIQGYEMQTNDGQCSIAAVKFTLKKKRTPVCSDPKNKKVIKTLEKLTEKK